MLGWSDEVARVFTEGSALGGRRQPGRSADELSRSRPVSGNLSNAELSPDGRYVSYVQLFAGLAYNEVRVAEVATGRVLDFAIRIDYEPQSPNVTYGRNRWLPDGSAIAFVGTDDSGRARIFLQDFAPGEDTSDTLRPLGALSDSTNAESFGISPDGQRFAISAVQEISVIKVAEGLGKLR